MDQQSGDSKEQRNDGGGEVRYAGVVFQSGKYRARIHDKTKKRGVWLGTFPTAEEAARAYDQAAIARGRHFNCLNFPEEHPDAAAAAAARGAAPPMLPLMTAEHPDASATGAANASTMTAAAAATVSSSSTSSMATREVTDAATAGAAANASTMTAAAATSSSSTSSMATKEVADEFDYLKGLKLDDLGVLPHLDDE